MAMAWLPDAHAPCGENTGPVKPISIPALPDGMLAHRFGQKIGTHLGRPLLAQVFDGHAQCVAAVEGRANQASGTRRGLGIHGQSGMGQGALAKHHRQDDKICIPVVSTFAIDIVRWIPIGNFADDVTARIGSAACDAAKTRFAAHGPPPSGFKVIAKGGNGVVADDKNFAV